MKINKIFLFLFVVIQGMLIPHSTYSQKKQSANKEKTASIIAYT